MTDEDEDPRPAAGHLPRPDDRTSHDQDGRDARDLPYSVGYKRPPLDKRFQKPQSGNPNGRPRRGKLPLDIGAMLAEVLGTLVTSKEGSRKRKRPISKVMLTRLAVAAAQGDHKAVRNVLDFLKLYPLPVGDRDRFGTPIDYAAEVRAKLERMAQSLEEQREPTSTGADLSVSEDDDE